MGKDKQEAAGAAPAAGTGEPAGVAPGKRTRSERRPGPPGSAPGRPDTPEQRCLEEYGEALPDDARDVTARMEGGADAIHSFVRDADGKVSGVRKRFRDPLTNASVVVFVELRPPVRMTRERAAAIADAEAQAVYERWLRERVDLISQLCAQRQPATVELTAPPVVVTPDEPGGPTDPPPGPDAGGGEPARPGEAAAPLAVHFAHGSAEPLDLARVIEPLRALVQARPGGVVRLDGHASSIGTDAVNLELSRARVAAVRRALTTAIPGLSVPPREGEAHGEAGAMETEAGKRRGALDEARAHNRRVDVRFEG